MGQKVIPIGIRLGINRTWNSKWYAEKRIYADQLEEDLRIQRHIKISLKHAGISLVEVERSAQKMKVTIHSSRPGIIIGRRGEAADALKDELQRRTGREISVNIKEVKRPEIDYGVAEAKTTYGIIGVKVWVYKGEDYNQPRPLGRRRAS